MMKTVLLSAAVALTLGASPTSADDGRYYDDPYYGGSRYYEEPYYGYYDDRYDNGYYGNGGGYYDDYGNGGYGYGYSYGIVSPRSIVRNLRYQGFSYISRPALAGRFYQVKARDPNGHKVKLYIDAYSGRIVKVKG